MMAMASQGKGAREGVRMGMWGASQAIAFGAGGFLGTVVADLGRLLIGAHASLGSPYAVVFGLEAIAFIAAAWMALRIRIGNTGNKPAEASIHADAVDQNKPPLTLIARMEGSD
jgi:BCD family chlorophyll transporter-like MFS transporter